jgi:outer membrane protein TolC
MKLIRWGTLLLLLLPVLSSAQSSESYHGLLTARVRSGKLTPPKHLQDYVQSGKISLGLRDAILLTLENNSAIQIDETQIESQKFSLLGSFTAFDPSIQSTFNANRSSTLTYSQLQVGGPNVKSILTTLNQTGQVSYTQTFTPGTNIVAQISSNKSSTNSSYDYFNPYYSSTLNLQFTQPLLRGAGRFANLAPVIIARRSLEQSRASFEAEVNDAVLQVIEQYWTAVEARGALNVQKKSLDLAQVSYERDKRSLELGALPPLDIYRSESEVAARKVSVIQAAYTLTQAEDALRTTIGANQDSQFQTLAFDLTEKPQPSGELESVDATAALADALARRPEVEVVNKSLAIDDANIRLAHNQLLPNLSFTGFYQSNGTNSQYDTKGNAIKGGGFGTSMNQAFGFGYPGYGGTLTLTLPVRNRAGQATLGSALVSRTRDLYSGRQTREQIIRDVNDALHQLDEAKLALVAGAVSFDLAQKSLASDQRKFELGAETNYFVLDSQTKLAAAELVLLETQVDYQNALAAVRHATGSLLEPYRVRIADLSK